jgi:LAS superfamily LD-carboxypeptidase LdcB
MKKVLTLLALSTLFVLTGCNQENKETTTTNTNAQGQQADTAQLVIYSSTDASQSFTLPLSQDQTAFGLLQEAADQQDIDIQYDQSDLGVIIQSINGIANDTNNQQYWLWYVNDQMGSTAADQYVVQSGDQIRFEYGNGF